MRRLVVLGAAVAATAALAGSSHAAPFAGQYRVLESGAVTVAGGDGVTWRLSVAASVATTQVVGSEQHLYVRLERCPTRRCDVVGAWSRPLTAGEIAVASDLSSGRLHTVLGGRALEITLGPVSCAAPCLFGESGGGASVMVQSDNDHATVNPAISRSQYTGGKLVLGDLRCTLRRSFLGEVTEVDADDSHAGPPPTELPAGFLAGSVRSAAITAC